MSRRARYRFLAQRNGRCTLERLAVGAEHAAFLQGAQPAFDGGESRFHCVQAVGHLGSSGEDKEAPASRGLSSIQGKRNSYPTSRRSDGTNLLMIQKSTNGSAPTVIAPNTPSLNVSMLWGIKGMW